MTYSSKGVLALAAGAAIFATSQRVRAADTVEPFEAGTAEVDVYLGLDQLGGVGKAGPVFGDIMLGFGLFRRLGAYFGATLEGTDAFTSGATTHYFGVNGTPLDSNHVDLDLFLELSVSDHFELRPAFELNVDADPEMRTWGMYLRAPLPIYGRRLSDGEPQTTLRLESTVGAYTRVAPMHELLLEYDMAYRPEPDAGARRIELGAVAAGYNVTLWDGFELINQVSVDIPQGGETASFGVMTGFIATLPFARRPANPDVP